jgi:SAM-dependent methyltransferase
MILSKLAQRLALLILRQKYDYRTDYMNLVHYLKQHHSLNEAMHKAVGGEFHAVGLLEYYLLLNQGFKRDDYVIDVGCGSGRLARILEDHHHAGRYVGLDVVPDLIQYARQNVKRPDWTFKVIEGLLIPEVDNRADLICFFSVFTHLLHEQSYLYLEESVRVLKPGGKIIFSFLDFVVPAHWIIFESTMRQGSPHINMFIDRGMISVWAEHLGLNVVAIYPGDLPFIPLPAPITYDNGVVMSGVAPFGQSVCVLAK